MNAGISSFENVLYFPASSANLGIIVRTRVTYLCKPWLRQITYYSTQASRSSILSSGAYLSQFRVQYVLYYAIRERNI